MPLDPPIELGEVPVPGTARLLFRLPYEVDEFGWDVTPDGERFLVLAPEVTTREPSTTIIVDWMGLVRH
jgi:hypothetical protein